MSDDVIKNCAPDMPHAVWRLVDVRELMLAIRHIRRLGYTVNGAGINAGTQPDTDQAGLL